MANGFPGLLSLRKSCSVSEQDYCWGDGRTGTGNGACNAMQIWVSPGTREPLPHPPGSPNVTHQWCAAVPGIVPVMLLVNSAPCAMGQAVPNSCVVGLSIHGPWNLAEPWLNVVRGVPSGLVVRHPRSNVAGSTLRTSSSESEVCHWQASGRHGGQDDAFPSSSTTILCRPSELYCMIPHQPLWNTHTPTPTPTGAAGKIAWQCF